MHCLFFPPLTEPLKPFPLFICRGSCNILCAVQKTWPATVTAAPMANLTLGWTLMKTTVSKRFCWIHQKRLKHYRVFLYLPIPSSISSYILGKVFCVMFVCCCFDFYFTSTLNITRYPPNSVVKVASLNWNFYKYTLKMNVCTSQTWTWSFQVRETP